METEIHAYKGYSIQALVFPHTGNGRRTRERSYDVAVRISRVDDATSPGSIFRLPMLGTFEHVGEARRAGTAHALRIIDGEVPGSSLTA